MHINLSTCARHAPKIPTPDPLYKLPRPGTHAHNPNPTLARVASMASTDKRDRPFFDEHEYEDDDDDFDEEEFTDEGLNDPLNPNPNAVSFASPNLPENGALQPAPIPIHERKLAPFSDSRRLFQRLWTDEDEIVILEGFLDFVTRRGTTHNNYQHDTGSFYEQIKNKIQLDFNKNQLIEKIQRLKKKYRTVESRMKAMGQAFTLKSAHEEATYEISKQIWSSTFKRPRNRRYNPEKNNLDADASNGVLDEIRVQPLWTASEDPNLAAAVAAEAEAQSSPVSVSSVVEETVKCCPSPLFKELLQHGIGGRGGNSDPTRQTRPDPTQSKWVWV